MTVNKEKWLVILGSFQNGFTFVGPFDNWDDAKSYVGNREDFNIVESVDPEDEKVQS